MGADLRDAKRVCREDGTLFTAWCESAECPVGYSTAKRLMSVQEQLSIKKSPGDYFEVAGIKVLAEITMTRDEDIRQALLEHIESEAGMDLKAYAEESGKGYESLKIKTRAFRVHVQGTRVP